MLKLRKALLKKKNGFTLIELIVVIAILAIIALLAIPRYLNTLENARMTTDDANARIVESAAALYYADNAAWPATVDAMVTADYLDSNPLTAPQYYASMTLGADGMVTKVAP